MPTYEGVDFYRADRLLSDEERAVRESVREFVSDRVIPLMPECFEHARFPMELVPEMAALGLYGANLPEKYGCAGVSNVAYGLIMQELERGDSGIRSFASVQGALVMYPIYEWGSDAQKDHWLPLLARGEKIGCFGLTEPDFGSNPAGMLTRAERRGDMWILNGTKMWITNGTIADVAVVWARTADGVTGFLVEKETKGFTAPEQTMKMSLRASVTSELVLDNVEVPEANRLPGAIGMKCPFACLTQARYGIAWGAAGSAMECFDIATRYSKERVQFSKPIAAYQLQQAKLADMLTEITKAQLLCIQLGRLKDQGEATPAQVSLAKRNNVAMALDVARSARTILGANGIMLEYHVIRHAMNMESVYTYEGTHDIHTLILGEEITGLKAYD